MTVDVTNFLYSLAHAMAEECAGDGGAPLQVSRDLWVGTSINTSADPRAVIAAYPGIGPDPMVLVEGLSVQVKATGSRQRDVMALARRLFESLLDLADGEDAPVKCNWVIDAMKLGTGTALVADTDLPNGWTVLGVVLNQFPAPLGRDRDNNDFTVVFNMDVRFCAND